MPSADVQGVHAARAAPEPHSDAGWKTFFFFGYGLRADRNCARCPETVTALKKIPGMVSGYYSILAPGKSLPPHRGPYNGVLRFHLGLKIPASDDTCAITVGSATRSWAEGNALIFDDTSQRTAWNLTPEWRAVLFVDFLRPLPLVPRVLNRLMIWLPAARVESSQRGRRSETEMTTTSSPPAKFRKATFRYCRLTSLPITRLKCRSQRPSTT